DRAQDGHFDAIPLTSRIPQAFLGVRLDCVQCHDHPYSDRLKQSTFWGVNAFLRQLQREGNPPTKPGQAYPALTLVDDDSVHPDPAVFMTRPNGVVAMVRAQFLPGDTGGAGPKMDRTLKGLDRRKALARFVVEHDNFARASVNRIWGT